MPPRLRSLTFGAIPGGAIPPRRLLAGAGIVCENGDDPNICAAGRRIRKSGADGKHSVVHVRRKCDYAAAGQADAALPANRLRRSLDDRQGARTTSTVPAGTVLGCPFTRMSTFAAAPNLSQTRLAATAIERPESKVPSNKTLPVADATCAETHERPRAATICT